jgi:hypothetical protein
MPLTLEQSTLEGHFRFFSRDKGVLSYGKTDSFKLSLKYETVTPPMEKVVEPQANNDGFDNLGIVLIVGFTAGLILCCICKQIAKREPDPRNEF